MRENALAACAAGILACLFAGCATDDSARTVSLEEAIQIAAKNIEDALAPGAQVAALNFISPQERFSEYVIEELSIALVSGKKLLVVDRKKLDLLRDELRFQNSGEVSDESMQRIGALVGAQFILSGSIEGMKNFYRFRLGAIHVATAVREASAALNVSGEDEQIAFLLGPAARPAATPAGGVYKPGDTGPAGGIVFFDKGTAESGWRYLEAAPRDIGPSHWGAYGFSLDTGAHTGSGKRNTQNILSALRRYAGNSYAAQLCEALEINGYADWFLPGIDELNLMYTNLKKKGLGGFTADWYWSSSQKNSLNAWGQGFGDGSRAAYGKNYPSRVRAVRAF